VTVDGTLTLAQPRHCGQAILLDVAFTHERETRQLTRKQAHLRAGLAHLLLAHFLEAHGAVEQHGLVVAWFEKNFAGQKRHTYLGITLYIAIKDAAQPMAA
jgi:hypothetical protein